MCDKGGVHGGCGVHGKRKGHVWQGGHMWQEEGGMHDMGSVWHTHRMAGVRARDMTTEVDGTHPAGMHSCWWMVEPFGYF